MLVTYEIAPFGIRNPVLYPLSYGGIAVSHG